MKAQRPALQNIAYTIGTLVTITGILLAAAIIFSAGIWVLTAIWAAILG
ncbi:hypothetical protein ACUH97_08025 [Dermabacteraceae bacterium P13088]